MKNICLSKLCTGCGACSNICPKNCIELKFDTDGFLRPIIDKSKCVRCKKCEQVCPGNEDVATNVIRSAYIASSKDEEILKTSSSGGIFSELAKPVLLGGGAVFGAMFSEKFDSVQHCLVEEYRDIAKLRGSKYIQSEMLDNYRQVKRILNENRTVLFSGTPCQVAGLKSYLGRQYEKLLTVDFVCHGVASTKAFTEYLDSLKLDSKITSICFRDKGNGYTYKNNLFKVVCENKKVHTEPWLSSSLGFAFANNLLSRPSCETCKYASTSRVSDITLSDYFGGNDDAEQKEKGVSLVLVNTEKGDIALSCITENLKIKSESIGEAITLQKHLSRPAVSHRNRKAVFKRLGKWSWKEISESLYTPYKPARTIKSIIKKCMSYRKQGKGEK